MAKRKRGEASAGLPGGSRATKGQEPMTPEQVVKLVVRHHLAEIEIEQGGTRIRVVREHAPVAAAPARGEPAASREPLPSAAEAPASPSNLVTVEAPMVGTFYRAPSPDAAPFVSEGDLVEEGQPLGIIEAMKLMNEIEAKVAGRIAKVLVENAQPVEYGQPLFLVDPRH